MRVTQLRRTRQGFPLGLVEFSRMGVAQYASLAVLVLGLAYFCLGAFTLLTWENSWWVPDTALKAVYAIWYSIAFLMSYCIAWMLFDPVRAFAAASNLMLIALGVIFVVSPLDIVPDVLPLIGIFDDIIAGGGMILIGVLNIRQRQIRAAQIAAAVDRHASNPSALSQALVNIYGMQLVRDEAQADVRPESVAPHA